MFCADYISAYIYHAAINVYLHQKEKDEFLAKILTQNAFVTGMREKGYHCKNSGEWFESRRTLSNLVV